MNCSVSPGGAGDCCHVWSWVRISAQTSSFLWGGSMQKDTTEEGRTDGRAEGRRGGISPQNDLPLGTGRHAAGRLPASIYQRRPHPEYCLSFCQEANQINKGTNGRGERENRGSCSSASSSRRKMERPRSQRARLSPFPAISMHVSSWIPLAAAWIPPPRRMISPSLIYGSLSALLSLHPRTHSSNCPS